MKTGLYEEIISNALEKEINKIDKNIFEIETGSVSVGEAHDFLSRYFSAFFYKLLRDFRGNPQKQAELINKTIEFIGENLKLSERDFEELTENKLNSKSPNQLLSIFEKTSGKITRPESPLNFTSLFTGALNDLSLVSELKKEILSSDRILILVSFIKWSGVRLLLDELKEFTSRKNSTLRVVTSTYMQATDSKAVEKLSQLKNTEIRISYDEKTTRMHAKAFLFIRDNGYTTGYIGSSNLSNPALTSGLEWNIKVTQKDNPHIIQKFEAAFETYWESLDFEEYDSTKFKKALEENKQNNNEEQVFKFSITPFPYQIEILEKLESERLIHNRYKNLIIAATGTGKTVISAFDYKNFVKLNPKGNNTLLFIAHREEILKQSRSCFRHVLLDMNFGDILTSKTSASEFKHLFISVQSLHSRDLYEMFKSDYFDFIIVDEIHHGAAKTYEKIFKFFKPKILLGLTATPERMDGKDIKDFFDGHFAAEIRIWDALNRKILSPFQYFGVSDCVGHDRAWRNGKYENSVLEGLFNSDVRALLIFEKLEKYLKDINSVCCLGFCVSIKHAKYMATKFNEFGLKAEFLTGNDNYQKRTEVNTAFKRGEINYLFTVDLYNEGIDIPEIDTVLFLRPTDSITIFLQQLGRGLRLAENKECLTVLDFIGQVHKTYTFEPKFRALTGFNGDLEKEVKNGFPYLPLGCFVQLEKMAEEYVLENIKMTLKSYKNSILEKIRTFESQTNQQLTLKNFMRYYDLKLQEIYRFGLWSRLLSEAGLKTYLKTNDTVFEKGIKNVLHLDSKDYIDNVQKFLSGRDNFDSSIIVMFFYAFMRDSNMKEQIKSEDEFRKFFEMNQMLKSELIEVLEILEDKVEFADTKVNKSLPLSLHCKYKLKEILAAFSLSTYIQEKSFREGVLYIEELKTDLFFITLNKSEKDFTPTTMYEDYAVSVNTFHWQSQSRTSVESPTGERYIKHKETGNKIMLFVRDQKSNNGITSPYYFLGYANYLSHKGSRPISITWQLEHEMPYSVFRVSNRMVV